MFLNSYQKDLVQIKAVLKEYLSVEINHSSKSYFYESELADLWRNLAYPFQNMTSTIINSMPLQLFVLNDLSKQTLEGPEKSEVESKIAEFNLEPPMTNSPYHIILANK